MALDRKRSRNLDQRAKDALDIFEMSYEFARPHLEEHNKVQQAYDQIVDEATWETSSTYTLGQIYAIVQNMIPAIMYYTLWAPETPFEAIPRDSKISYDIARKVRDNIVYTQRERMDLETQGYYTILDALKLGVGYCLVEPKQVQLPDYGVSVAAAGTAVAQRASLGVGATVDITSCRWLGSGQVFPTPDGAEPEEVSAITVLDFATEGELRRMYDREDSPFEGDPEEIIDYARKNHLNGYTSSARKIASWLARQSMQATERMNRTGKNTPILIPILKQYNQSQGQHIWLASDKFVMYEIKDKFQTLHSPLTKATFAPEGGQWFTKGLGARAYDPAHAIEVWTNAMYDLLSMSLHPHQIIDRNSLLENDEQEDMKENGRSYVRGDPNKAISFVQWPTLPAQAYAIPDKLKSFTNEIVGSGPSAQGAGTPGLVRGGSGAMESLLQVSSGREKAAARHSEGWVKQVTLQTLIHNQILIGDKDEYTIMVSAGKNDAKGNVNEGDTMFKLAGVSADEIRQEWRLEFNYREKLKNFIAEAGMRLQQYDRLKENPNVNQEELVHFMLGDEYVADRLMRGADVEGNTRLLLAQGGGGGQSTPDPAQAGRGVGIPV